MRGNRRQFRYYHVYLVGVFCILLILGIGCTRDGKEQEEGSQGGDYREESHGDDDSHLVDGQDSEDEENKGEQSDVKIGDVQIPEDFQDYYNNKYSKAFDELMNHEIQYTSVGSDIYLGDEDRVYRYVSKNQQWEQFYDQQEWAWTRGRAVYWKDVMHIPDEYTEEDVSTDLFDFSPYETFTAMIGNQSYAIEQAYDVHGECFFIEANSHGLYRVLGDYTGVTRVSEKPVRDVSYNGTMLFYTTRGPQMSMHSYSLNLDVRRIEKDMPIRLFAVNQDELFVITPELHVKKYDVNQWMNQSDEHLTPLFDVEIPIDKSEATLDKVLSIDVLGDYVYMHCEVLTGDMTSSRMVIINRETGQLYDRVPIREMHVTRNGRVFYTINGYLLEYTTTSKGTRLVDVGYHLQLYDNKNKLAIYNGVDGPGSFVVVDMDADYLRDMYPESQGYDDVLFVRTNEYMSSMYIYDWGDQSFQLIDESLTILLYHVNEEGILYGAYPLSQMERSDDSEAIEWQLYSLPHEDSVFVINDQIERVRQEIGAMIQEGTLSENEVYMDHQGQFMIYPSLVSLDNETPYRQMEVYRYGAHQKGYTYFREKGDEGKLPIGAVVETIRVHENEDAFYIIYRYEAKEYVALYHILEEQFRLEHIKTEPHTGSVRFNESGSDIIQS